MIWIPIVTLEIQNDTLRLALDYNITKSVHLKIKDDGEDFASEFDCDRICRHFKVFDVVQDIFP